MGALFGGVDKKSSQVVNQTVPEPEKTADPTAIGNNRKQEDQSLFGGSSPDLRVDRPSDTAKSVSSAGSGLKLM